MAGWRTHHFLLITTLLMLLVTACAPAETRQLPTLMLMPDDATGTQSAVIRTAQAEIGGYVTPTPEASLIFTGTSIAIAPLTVTATFTALPPASTATPTPTTTETSVPTPTPTETNTPTPTLLPLLWFDHNQAHVLQPTTLFAGPNVSFMALEVLPINTDVRIVERNRVGNWLHVRQTANSGVTLDGWVMTGHLKIDEQLRFSIMPVNTTIADGDASTFAGQPLAPLYAAPIIPVISPDLRAIYQRGLAQGKRGNAVTKIGDSVSANPIYLAPMRRGDHVLGPYDYLETTIDFFGTATVYESVAAQVGLSSFGVFDPLNAASDSCKPNESPLTCEFRRTQPTVAFIMFGPNDQWSIKVEEFDTQMRLLVDETLRQGVIPILTTYSSNPQRRSWESSIQFNLAVLEIGKDYNVPVMNLWLASRDLPEFGLEHDGIHMKNYGFRYLKFDSGLESYYGVSLQNLVALRVLDEIRQTIIQPQDILSGN